MTTTHAPTRARPTRPKKARSPRLTKADHVAIAETMDPMPGQLDEVSYVKQYVRLDEQAKGASSKAEVYKQQAETAHWEQCRIAYEAVKSLPGAPIPQWTRTGFAKEVGRSRQHIELQVRMWENAGKRTPRGVTYAAAYSTAKTGTPEGQGLSRDLAVAKKVMRSPELAKQVLSDPESSNAAADEVAPETTPFSFSLTVTGVVHVQASKNEPLQATIEDVRTMILRDFRTHTPCGWTATGKQSVRIEHWDKSMEVTVTKASTCVR